MAATLDEVTIVVVTWQSATELPPLLASLAPVTAAGAELVVIDNASVDEGVALVRTHAPTARLVVNAVNRGFGAAANQGFEATDRRFVLFLNPDTVVTPDAVPRALAYLDGVPAVGIVGCRTLNADGTLQPTVDRFHSVRGLVAEAWWGAREVDVPRGVSPAVSGVVDWVYGSFLLGRRAALTAVGGFDEAYEMYGEDLDLCHRLRAAGWATAYCADATVIHHGNRSGARRYGADRDLAVLRGTLRFFRRRRGRLAELGFRLTAGVRFAWQSARASSAASGEDEAAAVRARRYAAMARLCLDGDPAGRRADRARLRVRHAPGIEGT